MGITGVMRTIPTGAILRLTWWSKATQGQLCIDSGAWDSGPTFIPIEELCIHATSKIASHIYCEERYNGASMQFEPRYSVIILISEEWTKRPRPPPGLVWYTAKSKTQEGTRAILGYEAQYFFRKIHNSLPGRDICYLGLCL
jgi:hypothetical protein